ncbi:hypothetical protein [Corynebacterium mayonis]|uniref:hypothetical protein n=1 Tax=Corynebacterium mayonis TaxID=3062461 RepID=UPI003140A8AC
MCVKLAQTAAGQLRRSISRGVVLATSSPRPLDDVHRARATIAHGALIVKDICPAELPVSVEKARAAHLLPQTTASHLHAG